MRQNVAEEYQDLLDSEAWKSVVSLACKDAEPIRMVLLTSLTLDEKQRIAKISRLATYKDFFEKVYDVAGRKLPPKLLDLFTGGTSG